MRRTRTLIASDVVLLDPRDCGSTIGYVVMRGRRGIHGDVSLSDCNRKIEWYFSSDESAVTKIDKAIKILVDFREALVKARSRSRRRK